MGFSPRDAKQETPFDIWAAWLRYHRYHSGAPEQAPPLTHSELDALIRQNNPNG